MPAENTSPEIVEPVPAEPEVMVEDLIEEVSVDGMCGVY
jgi:mycofactocin precursor